MPWFYLPVILGTQKWRSRLTWFLYTPKHVSAVWSSSAAAGDKLNWSHVSQLPTPVSCWWWLESPLIYLGLPVCLLLILPELISGRMLMGKTYLCLNHPCPRCSTSLAPVFCLRSSCRDLHEPAQGGNHFHLHGYQPKRIWSTLLVSAKEVRWAKAGGRRHDGVLVMPVRLWPPYW